jgi:hypothetical protein
VVVGYMGPSGNQSDEKADINAARAGYKTGERQGWTWPKDSTVLGTLLAIQSHAILKYERAFNHCSTQCYP